MTDVVSWPGYAFIAAAVLALVGSLAAFGSGHHSTGLVAAGIAVVVAVLGALWLMTEYRRLRGIEERWRAEHPEVPRPTGGH
jgi:hypothetical protein